jgi:hypothetical protein
MERGKHDILPAAGAIRDRARMPVTITEALIDPVDRTEAATALRSLIDKIVLMPGAKRGEISAQLFGNLETVLAWAPDRAEKRRDVVDGFPWEVDNALSVSVGAGTCITTYSVVSST